MPRDRRDDDSETDLPRYSDARPRRKIGLRPWMIALIVAVPVLMCGGLVVLSQVLGNWARGKLAEHKAAHVPISADALTAEWKQNPAAAADKYKSGVKLTGTLRTIDSNLGNQTYIDVCGAGRDSGTHIFVLDEKAKVGLKKCKVGDAVTVWAVPTGQVQPQPWLMASEIQPGG